MVPYVRRCIAEDREATREGYVAWYDGSVENKNYAFLYHLAFSYLLLFKLFNEAVRKNNSLNIMAARSTFAPLFYCGHHPKYQLLLLRDLCQRVNYSPEIATYMTQTESFTVSGKSNAGQGADFIHEEVNREIKSFLPPSGLPSKATWVNIIRKTKLLKKLKTTLLSNSNIDAVSGEKRHKIFDHEVAMVRRKLQSPNILTIFT